MVERLILNQRRHGTRKNASLCVARRLNKTIFKMIRHYRWKLVRNAGQICSRFFTFTFRCRWNCCQQMLKCEFTSLSVDESQGSTMKSKLSVGKSIHWFEIWSMFIRYLSQNIEFPCKRTFNSFQVAIEFSSRIDNVWQFLRFNICCNKFGRTNGNHFRL